LTEKIRNVGTGKDWRLVDFMTAWQDAVPTGATVERELLLGVAVTIQSANDEFVRYLPASDVRDIPDARDRIRIRSFFLNKPIVLVFLTHSKVYCFLCDLSGN